jgi:hypothetical protein
MNDTRVFIRRARGDHWAAKAVEAIENGALADWAQCTVLAVFPGERTHMELREIVIMFRCPRDRAMEALDLVDERLMHIPGYVNSGEFPNY